MVDFVEAGQAVYQPLEKSEYAGATIFIAICLLGLVLVIFWMFAHRR